MRKCRFLLCVGLALLILPLGAFQLTPTAFAAAEDEPTPEEQYIFELIQRCRANPDAEAARFGIDLNEGLAAGTLPSGARQPLAFNFMLLKSARDHCRDLIDNFPNLPTNHNGSDGRTSKQRMTDAGADTTGWSAENIAWTTNSGSKVTQSAMAAMHKTLFVDKVDAGRGHRKTLVFGVLSQGGVGGIGGNFAGTKRAVLTEDFISKGGTHIVGVAYADTQTKDSFYTPGEQMPGLTIKAMAAGGGTFTTTTWRSGGYNLEVPAGTYTVTAEGPGLAATMTVTNVVVGTQNVKVDFVVPDPGDIPPPPQFDLLKAAKGKLSKKTGQWTLAAKKFFYTPGFLAYTGDLSELKVLVDGEEHFPVAGRATQIVKTKQDKAGKTTKITIKDASKNKITIDLKKKKLVLMIKAAPGLDPTDGQVTIQVDLGGSSATMTAPATISGKKLNKAVVGPAVGTVVVM